MQELLLGIWESARKTVLFVTHDIDEAIFMANRVAVFSARPGRIKSEIAVDFPIRAITRSRLRLSSSALKARLTEEIRAEADGRGRALTGHESPRFRPPLPQPRHAPPRRLPRSTQQVKEYIARQIQERRVAARRPRCRRSRSW